LNVYADTSVLVSLYVWDSHLPVAKELMRSNPRVFFTPFHLAECFHAIAQQVFQRRMTTHQAQCSYRDLQSDLNSGVWLEVPMPESAFVHCAELARSQGPKFGIRTLDSLHVACALELKAERFWTFDERQARLAKAAGLKAR
jgi:predicted nucleic acid-binding protein